MANQFIGFPVPRAKIAEMIEGDIEAAGGVAFPLRGLWLDDYDADHTRWRKTYTGSGALTRSYEGLALQSDDTPTSTAHIYRRAAQPIPTLTWAKKRHIVFDCYLDCDSVANTLIHIISGWLTNLNHIGFEISGGKLWGINGNSGGQTKTEIKTFSGAYIGEDITLEAIHFPGEKVEFWVNCALEQTSTTNLPNGTAYANRVLYLKVDNAGTANNVEIDFNHIQLYQET